MTVYSFDSSTDKVKVAWKYIGTGLATGSWECPESTDYEINGAVVVDTDFGGYCTIKLKSFTTTVAEHQIRVDDNLGSGALRTYKLPIHYVGSLSNGTTYTVEMTLNSSNATHKFVADSYAAFTVTKIN